MRMPWYMLELELHKLWGVLRRFCSFVSLWNLVGELQWKDCQTCRDG